VEGRPGCSFRDSVCGNFRLIGRILHRKDVGSR
jgi:hypothetical protein